MRKLPMMAAAIGKCDPQRRQSLRWGSSAYPCGKRDILLWGSPGKKLYLQDEMAFMEIQKAVLFHFPQLQRQAAALHRQIIRQLLTGEGDNQLIRSQPLASAEK